MLGVETGSTSLENEFRPKCNEKGEKRSLQIVATVNFKKAAEKLI